MWLTGPAALRHVGSSQTRARTRVPCIGRQILNHCATREALYLILKTKIEVLIRKVENLAVRKEKSWRTYVPAKHLLLGLSLNQGMWLSGLRIEPELQGQYFNVILEESHLAIMSYIPVLHVWPKTKVLKWIQR